MVETEMFYIFPRSGPTEANLKYAIVLTGKRISLQRQHNSIHSWHRIPDNFDLFTHFVYYFVFLIHVNNCRNKQAIYLPEGEKNLKKILWNSEK